MRKGHAGNRQSLTSLGSAGCFLLLAPRLQAHVGQAPQPHDLWSSWNLEVWLLLLFGLAITLYARGLVRLWRQAGAGRGVSGLQALAHGSGIVLLLVALVSPLDALGEALASAHMAQHMTILAAAPLLVLGAPLPVYLWALPLTWRRRLGAGSRYPAVARSWQLLTAPFVAWTLYALALWAWHVPALYQLALNNPLAHDLEHFSFLASGLVFWWVVLRAAPKAIALLMLFTTMLHCGLLGALMSFSARLWYPAYLDTTAAWNLLPMQDQQWAGLIMLIPGGLGYLVASLGMLALWLGRLSIHARPEVQPCRT